MGRQIKKQFAYALAFFYCYSLYNNNNCCFKEEEGPQKKERENIDSDVGLKKTIALKKHTITLFLFLLRGNCNLLVVSSACGVGFNDKWA